MLEIELFNHLTVYKQMTDVHMDKQRLDDHLEPIYNSPVLIQVVAWKTCQERWMIEMSGERRSGRSMLAAQYNDDDDDT